MPGYRKFFQTSSINSSSFHSNTRRVAASSAEAVAATAVHRQAQMHLAAHGAAAVDTEAAAERPPQACALGI
jgi:hypothetical protein